VQTSQCPARRWITFELASAALVGLLTFGIPLLLVEARRASHPELRVVEVGGRLSTYIMLDDARVLIINVSDPRDAHALLGRIRRPWEPGPSAIVASASGDSAAALLSTIEQTEPAQVIILGLPGAEPEWTILERACEQRAIELEYVPAIGVIRHQQADLSIESGERAAVVVSVDAISVVIGLGDQYPSARAAVVVSDTEPPAAVHASLLVRSQPLTQGAAGATELLVERNQSITLVIEPDRIVARGGEVRQPPTRTLHETLRQETLA
jgi:hypothetical protein